MKLFSELFEVCPYCLNVVATNLNHYCEGSHLEVKALDGQPRLDGKKFDEGKPKLGLVSTVFIWAVSEIMTMGAKKYGSNNWRQGLEWSRAYDALQRHLTKWWDGESIDPESGKSHLWHAACELMFLVEFEIKGIGKDDRYKPV